MIYYFRGDTVNGVDLIGVLEDKIVARKKKILSRYIGRDWKSLTRDEFEYWWRELGFHMHRGAYEGCKPEYVYYIDGIELHRVKARSLKGFAIRLFGRRVV